MLLDSIKTHMQTYSSSLMRTSKQLKCKYLLQSASLLLEPAINIQSSPLKSLALITFSMNSGARFQSFIKIQDPEFSFTNLFTLSCDKLKEPGDQLLFQTQCSPARNLVGSQGFQIQSWTKCCLKTSACFSLDLRLFYPSAFATSFYFAVEFWK